MKRARCQLAMREYFDIPEIQKKYSGIRPKEMHFTSKNSCSKQLITSIEIKFENFLQTCCRIQNLKESQKTENAFSEKKKNGLIMQPSFQVTDSAISGVIAWTCCVVLLVVVPFKIYYFTVYYCCGFGLIIIFFVFPSFIGRRICRKDIQHFGKGGLLPCIEIGDRELAKWAKTTCSLLYIVHGCAYENDE